MVRSKMTPGVMSEDEVGEFKSGLIKILTDAALGVIEGRVTGLVLVTSGDEGTSAASGLMCNPQQLLGAVHVAALQLGQEILELNKYQSAEEQPAQDAVSAGGTE